jgi:membrane fusion protein (multidrug efflux system)
LNRRAKLTSCSLVIIVVAALLAVRIWPEARASEKKSAGKDRPAQPVKTLIMQPERLGEDVIGTGTVRASETIDLHAENSGKVVALNFVEGAPVRKGDLLLQMDDSELQAQQARAEQRRKLAAVREERLRSLKEQGFSNLQDYDTAVTELAVQSAEIDLIKTQIAKSILRSPFDGVVGLRYVSEGAYITPSTRIARLQAVDEVKIDFSLPEKYGGRIRPGDVVEFSVAGVPERSEAKVYALEPQIDETTRTLLVRARAANPGGRFRPGAFARVTWRAAELQEALLVPAVALVPESDEPQVYVIEAGKAVARKVELGGRYGGRIQVVAGLQGGEAVVVAGVQQLRAGMAVTETQPKADGQPEKQRERSKP